jgi:ribonuclease P protein component
MTNGSQTISTAAVSPARLSSARSRSAFLPDNRKSRMTGVDPNSTSAQRPGWPSARLRKHADYQRVYKAARKQFSPSMSWFFRLRTADELTPLYTGPRVGLTAGRVLGKAVDRNRIKRRMREAARANLALLPPFADVVLHPRRTVLEVEFARLEREVAKIFSTVAAQSKTQPGIQAGAQR